MPFLGFEFIGEVSKEGTLSLEPRTNNRGCFWVGKAVVLLGRQGLVALDGPGMSLEFPRALQKLENLGGMSCLSSLVRCLPQWGSPRWVLQIVGTPCVQQRT